MLVRSRKFNSNSPPGRRLSIKHLGNLFFSFSGLLSQLTLMDSLCTFSLGQVDGLCHVAGSAGHMAARLNVLMIQFCFMSLARHH